MIAIRRRHDLGLTKAKRLAQTLAHQLQNEFGGTYTWEGNELRFQRTGVSGCATVTTDSIQIRVELGLLLRPLHARIEREIRAGLDTHLGHEDARTADRAAPSAWRREHGALTPPGRRPAAAQRRDPHVPRVRRRRGGRSDRRRRAPDRTRRHAARAALGVPSR